jgi:AhpD family alkylhydroperoxidase
MQARMKNPAMIVPGAMQAVQALWASVEKAGLPAGLLELVHLRASQINGCSFCVVAGAAKAKKEGASDERIAAVAAWRDAPYFTDAERAALALAEAVTRLSDRSDPVPDDLWNEARRHYDEQPLAALIVAIATVNVFNRINVPIRQVAGEWK